MSSSSAASNNRPINAGSISTSLNENGVDLKQQDRPLVIVLAGSTGVGKSAVAASLCSSIRASKLLHRDGVGQVVSADSVQAYKEVQIGANKPTLEERRQTPHHLIDLVDARSNYNAADWRKDAIYVIQQLTKANNSIASPNYKSNKYDHDDDASSSSEENEIDFVSPSSFYERRLLIQNHLSHARKQALSFMKDEDGPILPVVVGGTMMYLQWLVDGRPDAMKPSSTAVQKASKTVSSYMSLGEDGWQAAVEYTKSLGPLFEQRVKEKLGTKDWYRLRRILEVAYTASELQTTTKNSDNNNQYEEMISKLYSGQRYGGLGDYGYDVRCFFLCPDDRMKHTALVDARCEDMLIRGLLQETSDLYLKGHLPTDGQAARAIGYRQTLEYLQRSSAKENDSDAFDVYLNNFATATRRYAKKQMQWFRRNTKFAFVPIPVNNDSEEISSNKKNRIESAADIIQRMCLLPRHDYEKELLTYDDLFTNNVDHSKNKRSKKGTQHDEYYLTKEEEQLPISAQTKLLNERQGRNMKHYMPTRYELKHGTEKFKQVLNDADKCTSLFLNKT